MKRGVLLLSVVLLVGLIWLGQADRKAASLQPYDNLIRFHVIANSDTDFDQALKRDVRDKILQALKEPLSQAGSLEEARALVRGNLKKIETVAQREVVRQGYSYPVKAMLGNFQFPVKSYGYITLPAGNYEALRVVIGEGQGENWWCILFPPLCFVDISNSLTADLQQQVLPTLSGNRNKKGIQVRFKLLEIIRGAHAYRLGNVNEAGLETN